MDSVTIASYNKCAGGYAAHYYANDVMREERARFVSRVLQHHPILDLGCGPGQDAHQLSAHGLSVVGLDASLPMLMEGKARSVQAAWVCADYTAALPFGGGQFGGVWACSSLLHACRADIRGVFAEIARVTAPHGALYVSLMVGDGEGMREEARPFGTLNRFFAYYQVGETAQWLSAAGFEVDEASAKGRWLNVHGRRSP